MRIRSLILCSILLLGIQNAYPEVEVELLSQGSELDLKAIPIGVIGEEGLFCAIGNELSAVDMSETAILKRFTLPEDVVVNEFISVGDKIMVHTGKSLVWFGADGIFKGIGFQDDEFSIAPASDTTFYFLRPDEIIEVSLTTEQPVSKIKVQNPIGVSKFGSGVIFATSYEVWLLLPEGLNLLHKHPLPIKSFGVGTAGVFFCTESELWRLEGIDTLEHVATGSFDAIKAAGHILYVIDGEGNLYRFDYNPG